MPLPAEKGLKPRTLQAAQSTRRDLMPLPAEKGLKHIHSKEKQNEKLSRFDAPSSRKRIETDEENAGAIARFDLMPLPAEKGLKLAAH